MFLFVYLFSLIKKILDILTTKKSIFMIAGWIFVSLFLISTGFYCIFEYTNNNYLKIISTIIFKILIFYILCLLPFSNNKLRKNLKIVSHKSYISFVVYNGIILYGCIYWILLSINISLEFFINNSMNIIITLYGIITIIWFAYQIIHSNNMQILKKQLRFYIFIITFLRLFVINKYSYFEYCVLILTYVFIQYLFEDIK
jgi:hypothetical protein